MTTKKNNIIFMDGKEKVLQRLFSSQDFGYLAVGYNNSSDSNGFQEIDPNNENSQNGFVEISQVQSSTYSRVPLVFESSTKDPDTGKVTAKFTAELDIDNIIEDIPINQIAIVDSLEVQDASTKFFAASVTETFSKNEKLALVFVIEITM